MIIIKKDIQNIKLKVTEKTIHKYIQINQEIQFLIIKKLVKEEIQKNKQKNIEKNRTKSLQINKKIQLLIIKV